MGEVIIQYKGTPSQLAAHLRELATPDQNNADNETLTQKQRTYHRGRAEGLEFAAEVVEDWESVDSGLKS